MKEYATERIPVSSRLGVKNNEHLLMFYFILAFNEDIYYIEEEDVIVVFQQMDKQLHIFDIVSKNKVKIDIILNSIVTADTEIIIFHFTADYDNKNIETDFITESDDTLFIRPLLKDGAKHFYSHSHRIHKT